MRRYTEDFPEARVAVLSVDPTKQRTGGALLGDRIRFNALASGRVPPAIRTDGEYAHRQLVRRRRQLDPVDAQGQRPARGGFEQHGASAVGQHPAKEVLLEGDLRMSFEGLDSVKEWTDVIVYHAATKREEAQVKTVGGRVLGVTALGANLESAIARAYEAIGRIRFDGMTYRRDIGARALARLQGPRQA